MIKRIILILSVILLFPGICLASGYVLATYGTGGDEIDGPSLGIELGGIFLSDLHPTGGAFSFGLGISVGDSDEDPPSIAKLPLGSPVTGLIDYNDGNEQEVYLSFGAEMTPALFGVAGIGYTSQKIVTIGLTDGTLYEVDDETDNNISGMLQIRYAWEGFTLGIGYHSRRGAIASLGIAF
ncbi:MAG: hypothetical protein J7L53_06400 [Deltaproteobacteria bacterium]|nr:hypothetical protein [Deltaproteobacteria bacterium]